MRDPTLPHEIALRSVKILPANLRRVAVLETLLLAGFLAGLNLLLAPRDPGWLKINPSPYFLLPLLIGGRFGFLPGLSAGILGAVVVVICHALHQPAEITAFIFKHKLFLTTLAVAGALSGEMQRHFHNKLTRAEGLQGDYQHRIKELDDELYFLREAKSELDLIVATRDSELWTLDAEIRELYQSSDDDFYPRLLQILQRQTHLSDAAIYGMQESPTLPRRALIGSEKLLPDTLKPYEVEMVQLALERRMAVTIPEFWRRDFTQHRNYLIAQPILDSQERAIALLLVTGIPFFALNQKTVHLIGVIGKWAARIREAKDTAAGRFRIVGGEEDHKIFTAAILRQNVDLAFHSYQMHHLPSALALFYSPALVAASGQIELERMILPHVRPSDCAAQLNLDFPNIALLLPLTGERTALSLVHRIQEACHRDASSRVEFRLVTFEQAESAEELWRDLLDYAHEVSPVQR